MKTALLPVLAAMAAGVAACGGPDNDAQDRHVTDAERIAPEPAPAAEPAEEPADEPAAAPAPQAASSETLSVDGWGELRIGMTREEITDAYGEDANPNAVGGPEPEVCDEYRPEDLPQGFLLMLQNGKLARITLMRDAAVKTDAGLGVGDSAEDVKAAYGDEAVVSPHKYMDAPAEYVTVWSTGQTGQDYVQDESARGVRYEIGLEGDVEKVMAGGPAIQLVEGCL